MPVSTQRQNGLEVKCLRSYVVAPPSIHPNGEPYLFKIALDGALPEVNFVELLGLRGISSFAKAGSHESVRQAAPSDFALRYGKSLVAPTFCQEGN